MNMYLDCVVRGAKIWRIFSEDGFLTRESYTEADIAEIQQTFQCVVDYQLHVLTIL